MEDAQSAIAAAPANRAPKMAVAVPPPRRFRINFQRIGRNHQVAPLEVEVQPGPQLMNDLAEQVHRYARRHLGSSEYTVTVQLGANTGAGDGTIMCGRFGRFTITEIT